MALPTLNVVIGPYWHPVAQERERRAKLHLSLAAFLAKEGFWPIIAQVPFGHELERVASHQWTRPQWLELSAFLLRPPCRVHVLALGEPSPGTEAELFIAKELELEVLRWRPCHRGFRKIG